MNKFKVIIGLLILSAINLSVMVPGGGIDTRNFSHISPSTLSLFNIFLTTLGMVSLFLPYFIYRKQKWSVVLAFICGLCYSSVYIFDFIHIFPKSPDPMPPLLILLEALGIILSIPLMVSSYKNMNMLSAYQNNTPLPKKIYLLIALAIIVGIGIIIFSTKSAMLGD